MEFLNPTALYGLFGLPLLLLPYLIRGRPRRLVFSSLLLLMELSTHAHSRPWGRLRLPPIFFLQLLLLALLILALGEPVFSVRPSNIAVVLDNSASMQTLEGSQSRFAVAREEARDLLRGFAPTVRVDLYVTTPRLEKIRGADFSPAEAATVLATLQPVDLGELAGDFGDALGRLARDSNYDRVLFFTDHPTSGQMGPIRAITVGQPKENFAINSLEITRSSLVASRLEASVEIANFSPKDGKVNVSLKGGGKLLANRPVPVHAGGTASVNFDGFPLHPYYEAQIEASDALAIDNIHFAVAPPSENLRVLGITPRPQSLATLRSIPGVSLEVITPEAYEKRQRTGHSLEVFHFSAPASLPRSHALFILPPEKNPLVELKDPVSQPVISGWREPHPLTRYVNFALFRPTYGRPLNPRIFGDSIIESREGVLAIAGEHRGFRSLVLGFDPLPYLGRQNLPMSVFTLNFLDWFFEGTAAKSRSTGESFPPEVLRDGGVVTTPGGEKLSLKSGTRLYNATSYQGIYRVSRGKETELIAFNFHDPKESDLRDPAPIRLRYDSATQNSPSVFFSFWPYLLLLSLVLLLLEWFLNPPLTQSSLRLDSGRSAR